MAATPTACTGYAARVNDAPGLVVIDLVLLGAALIVVIVVVPILIMRARRRNR